MLFLQNGEFQFENVQQIIPKGFNIEPQKVCLNPGTAYMPYPVDWSLWDKENF